MNASFEWMIARRYLFSRERKALVSVITVIAMLGVAVGVAALIVVIGVMDGADEQLFGTISKLYPHIRITSATQTQMKIDPALLEKIRATRGVLRAEPVIDKQAILQVGRGGESAPAVVRLIGQDEVGGNTLYSLLGGDTHRTFPIDDNGILLGRLLAYRLQAVPYSPDSPDNARSRIQVSASNPVKTALGFMLPARNLNVMGWFNTKLELFDDSTAFVSSERLRKLFQMEPGTADYIHVKLKDPFAAEAVKKTLKLPGQYAATTWKEENGDFFGALMLEKVGLFVIMLLIILVAAFNIIGTLILLVIEKTREVGILRAMGASQGLIARIFLLDGMIIGLVGTLSGLLIGVTLCAIIARIKLELPETMIYSFDHLPVRLEVGTVSLILLCSLIICTLAALFPARQAAKLNPVEALSFD